MEEPADVRDIDNRAVAAAMRPDPLPVASRSRFLAYLVYCSDMDSMDRGVLIGSA